MKTKNFKLLPILVFAPLLMANSPAPMPTITDYDDIDVSYTFIEKSEDSLLYDMTITNKGSSFALVSNYLKSINPSRYFGHIKGDVFRDECLAPNQTKTFKFLAYDPIEDFIQDDTTWSTQSYDTLDDNIAWSNPVIEKNTAYYTIKADFKNLGDYYYSAIVELMYEDEIYYIDTDYNNKKYLCLYVEQEINPKDMEIRNITFFRSLYETYKGGKIIANATNAIYIFFGLILLGILLIPPAIIIPVSIVSYKRKKRNNINE